MVRIRNPLDLRYSTILVCDIHPILAMAQPNGIANNVLDYFQEVPPAFFGARLSVILICEFTMALRQRKKKTIPNLSDIHLPTLSLPSPDDQVQARRSILERLHESLVEEMAERPDPADNPNSGGRDIDDSPEYLETTEEHEYDESEDYESCYTSDEPPMMTPSIDAVVALVIGEIVDKILGGVEDVGINIGIGTVEFGSGLGVHVWASEISWKLIIEADSKRYVDIQPVKFLKRTKLDLNDWTFLTIELA
ncbi:hypothetical protein Clacol_000099 [Clathrus columnatus]|uniref:Uncharacterized protein n=1 Tax=Clathrus columnatus TaxID=1419009 RepID=A0AAV4ZWA8_9AGAM|nr:hypothetical protein Clacol_000099 [Clathrus columnatus]